MQEFITMIGPLFYPLTAFSVIGMALIIERLVFFIRLPKIENDKSFHALTQELQDNAGLAKNMRDEVISFRLVDVKAKLEHGVHLLRLVAVISPMLGLLGTVLGMIKAFKDIAGQTGPVIPSMIAEGLWGAMLTTAYGLSIALPCLFASFLFARTSEKRLSTFQQTLNRQSLNIEGVKLS